ncbi:MAG: glycyl-radical enzyme activating protein [Clostridia bacterium]|nr:glycyl-radical enzyme activating protein [Clostridia bacterium]
MGKVFNIQRFSTSDGPGIRTTVFLKGCPLSCIWCHNPESQKAASEIMYVADKCIGCKECALVCKNNAHLFSGGSHMFMRGKCIGCGCCISRCNADALLYTGEEMDADKVLDEVFKDILFYRKTGGMTLSGGEPLMQYDFSLKLLKGAKEKGVHTAVETSGYYPGKLYEIAKYTDLWLYDVKIFDESEHIKYTGVSNKLIMENLKYLNATGSEIILRCPIIPGINLTDEHFEKIVELSASVSSVKKVQFMPYHPLGTEKMKSLGREQKYENCEFLSRDAILPYLEKIKDKTDKILEIM